MVFDLIDDRDLVDSNIRDLFILVTQIKHAAFYVNDIAAKCGICTARNVYLFAQQLF